MTSSQADIVCNDSSTQFVNLPFKKYDVFISFRGEDTRNGFTSHLHAALCRSYVQTYIDYRIGKGKEVWAELLKAIKQSTLFLVVFSKNYASSTWCLNELIEIMKCNKKGHDVIPVFYLIDPSHVRKQTGSYHTSLANHKKQGREKMQKWKGALFEAANLSGFHSSESRTEPEMIEDIVKEVLGKLNYKYTNELGFHFILNENYSHVESSIIISSREVRIIGLWGMGGIGKTSLAAAIFHNVSSKYEGSCFLENVTEESQRHGLNYIYNRLLSTLLREDICIDTAKVIPSFVMRRLGCMKAFIVLDGLNTSKNLENMIGVARGWLGAGSTVIVTTRDKGLLMSGGVDEIHEVQKMNFQNSLRLFSLYAFNKPHPKQGYEEVSKRAVVYSKGIPLVLKVLGSFLRSKSEKEWDSALAKVREIPNAEIQRVLRLSYDELDITEKNIFLDIACFFKGCGRSKVTKILNACGFFADIGIRNLLDKALITITLNNCIQMHDLIQDIGREIVREESIKNPGRRTRLWDPEEIYDVLTNNRGTRAVEGILLDMDQIACINLSSKAFKNMPNLRLLTFQDLKGINSVYLPTGLDLLPKTLRYLEWNGFPLKSLPSTFCPEMLVELSLRSSNVEKLWDGVLDLPNLEKLDLFCSKHLIECPNLSGAPNLKNVQLIGCESLSHVDPSIFSLQKLECLNVSGCVSLKSLSSNTCSPSLKAFGAWDCINLQDFSVTLVPSIASASNLWLTFGWWSSHELPSSILHMKNIRGCCFPISDNLTDLPENFAQGIWLFDLRKHECDILITMHKVLPSPAFLSVRCLIFDNFHSLFELPENISGLSSLHCLILFDCAVVNLPHTIKYPPRLKYLGVGKCKMLQCISSLPQSIQCVRVWKCESLQALSSTTSEPDEKSRCGFLLFNCINLDPHSYETILKDAIVSIELGARLFSSISENEGDSSLDHDGDCGLYRIHTLKSGIWYFLLAMGDNVQDCFHYHSKQALVSVELPPNLLGFVYYLVLSEGRMGYGGCFGCECCLETNSGERIKLLSSFRDEMVGWFNVDSDTSVNLMSDHVLLWYDAQCCKQILDAVEGKKAINDLSTDYNPKVTFRFFVETPYDEEVVIKQCGFRWIYPSEDQIRVDIGGRCKSKRGREICVLENIAVQNRANGTESDEEEETIVPTKKLKQRVFGTPSNIEAGEIEDLRCLLEELLNIGFGGDLMQL